MITEQQNKSNIIDKVMNGYLISHSHTLTTVYALVLGSLISSFGTYALTLPSFLDEDKQTTSTIYLAMISFLIILVTVDSLKRWSMAKYLNSIIMASVFGGGKKNSFKYVSIFAIVFVMALDVVGSWATADKASELYNKSTVTNSLEYELLQSNIATNNSITNSYPELLSTWRESKSEAHSICNDKWKGWKAKYKATCKQDWNAINTMPINNSSTATTSQLSDVKAINTDFLSYSMFYIVFIVLLALTALMQYVTLISIHSQFEDILFKLTKNKKKDIYDHYEELISIQEIAEKKKATIEKASLEEEYRLDNDFFLSGEKIKHAEEMERNRKKEERARKIKHGETINTSSKSAFVLLCEESETNKKKSKIISESSTNEEVDLVALLLEDVEIGEKLVSRVEVRKRGFTGSNDDFKVAYELLKEKGIIKDISKGQAYKRLK
jgi:hypothetical protein